MSVADSITTALLKFGRAMTLRRPTMTNGVVTYQDVTVYGHTKGNAPSTLIQQIAQGTTYVTIGNKQIADAGWPGPPRGDDVLVFDNRRTIILSVEPKYLGSTILVYELEVKG